MTGTAGVLAPWGVPLGTVGIPAGMSDSECEPGHREVVFHLADDGMVHLDIRAGNARLASNSASASCT
jgi:hypothetical protein